MHTIWIADKIYTDKITLPLFCKEVTRLIKCQVPAELFKLYKAHRSKTWLMKISTKLTKRSFVNLFAYRLFIYLDGNIFIDIV